MRNQGLILTFCLLSSLVLTAQDNYRAVHWDLQDGLSQAETYHMIKDVNGFLWIGTRGELSRFDGSTFKNFYYDPTKKGTINAKSAGGGLVEDSLHNIWIGTDQGLYRYDIKADVFSQFLPDAGADAPILFIYPLLATKDTLFCLESDTIITAYDVNTLQKKNLVRLLRTDEIGNGLSSSYAHYDAASRSMWMLKGFRGRPGGGLLRVSLSTGEKKFFGWSCFRNIKDHSHEAESMCYDHKRNCLWLNSGEGLMQFTLDDNQFHHIDPLNNLLDVKESHHFVGITLDHQHRVWVATAQKGIVIYNPEDHSVTFPFKEGSEIQNEVSHANAKIYIDRDGIIWSGFWLRKGIYQIIPFSPSIRRYKADLARKDGLQIANVINFENAGQGKLLIGSNDGLHVFDFHANSFQALREKELPGYSGRFTVPLAVDSVARRALLLSPPQNLFSMDLETRRCTQLILRDSAGQKIENYNMVRARRHKDEFIITSLIKDRQKIFILKTDSVVAHEIFSIPTNPLADFFDLELILLEDYMFLKHPRGRNLTFVFRNQKWTQSPSPLDSLNWTHIAYNRKDQSFWAVIEKQLVKFDMNLKRLKTYTPKAGLPDIEIYNIIADARGNMWFNTDRSIHQLNVETGVVSALTEKDGFEPQAFSQGPPMTMASDGDLYLGGGVFGEGFVRITPEKYTNTASVIYLRSLEINQQPLQLSVGVNNLQELPLKHFENKISFETGTIDYYSKGKGYIRYKLQGINDDWQYEPAGYTIRYDGLLPGKYTLLMQSSNAANEFIGPIKSLSIIISPPWWRAWWAYAAYTIMFASVVWGFIYYRSRELRRRNILLEEKVLQRTNDLNRSLEELKQTQNQLIQSEKMASLGELTAGIAHEIQNPLNFVNNFSEVSNELLEEMKEQIAKGNYNEVKTLSDDVIQNLEKILHHGKRADGIVKGMLQHSRNSSGAKEATNINTLADEYLRLAYHGLRAKDKSFNVTIHTHFQDDIGTINIIPQDIGRVILNLITNAFYAVKLRKQQEPEIEPMIIVRTKREGGKVVISVKDNGTGIPQKVLEKIFHPFFTTKPVGQGTGLGLSLSYDIIKVHNGELKVVTKEGEGSEFLITLP